MKKLFVLSVFVLFGLISTTTFAQAEEVAETVATETAEVQDKTEVKVSELPEAVAKTLKDSYADFTAEKASKVLKQNANSKRNEAFYLVTLTKGEENLTVLIDAAGKVIK